ncbi:unnamed protein product [Rotaria sp. Silwood2]|nr:unnamed protein product [Rotaria sp. Silwood2]
MSKQKPTTTVISGAAAMPSTTAITNVNNRAAAVLLPSRRRVLQNFLLVWLDTDFDEFKDDYKKSIQHLRNIVETVTTFTDIDECIDFLSDIENENVFMIVSGILGQHLIPLIQDCPQLVSIYIFCDNQVIHERWAKIMAKVKGVYAQIEPICEALQIDRGNCDRAMISISFNGIDPLFMYTQFLKEALLDIEDDDANSIKELVEYCRLQGDASEKTIEKIEEEYHNHSPIWWYTGPYFIYSMLNCGLRQMDVDIIMKMGFFIRHLHNHITELHRQQQGNVPTNFQVFRGQGLSMKDFEKMKKTKGGLMSFNNFLSTSRNREISLDNFARSATENPNSVGILFVMSIDTAICTKSSTPFAEVSQVSFYKDREEEILFSTHTIFRIDQIERIEDENSDRLWQVNLIIVGNQDDDFNKLTAELREELNRVGKGWPQLGQILIQVGEFKKAEHLYHILLGKASSDEYRAQYQGQLALIYNTMGDYSKAISYSEKSQDIKKKTLSLNDLSLASSYNNIGLVYFNMGEYSKALSLYERALEIQKIALPPNHPDLAKFYSNIGLVYYYMGEYSKALSSHERALEIWKRALPPNHPLLAASYNNIGGMYDNMSEYSIALSLYERALEIQKIALPPNHPDFALSYNNIGDAYNNMGEYSKALLSYERALEIRKIAFPPNHPSLAASYNNIGWLNYNVGEYSKALACYETALRMYQKSFPPKHPEILRTKTNIALVKTELFSFLFEE